MTMLLRALLVVAMVFVVAACQPPNQGGSRPTAAEETEEPEETEDAEPTATEAGSDGDGVSIFTLSDGDCVNVVDAETNLYERVDCDDEHEYEIYAILEVEGESDEEWPGKDELTLMSGQCSAEPFEDFVGRDYVTSDWFSLEIVPSEDEWDEGARTIPCLLYDPERETTTGSAEGSEEGSRPDETDASEFPSPEEEHLLSHIPEEFRDECGETDFGVVGIATIGCGIEAAGGNISITYNEFETEEEMYESYENNLEFLRLERDTGACTEWPGEEPYQIGGEEAGRVGCAELGSALIITWTDDELLIKGYAEGFGVDREEFTQWWLEESGPLSEEDAGGH